MADTFKSGFGNSNYYGGDGTTTFAVPNLQGEFLRGTGTNSHTNQGDGDDVGKHQDATFINKVIMDSWGIIYQDADKKITGNTVNYNSVRCGQYGETKFSTRPTNTSVLYCIKY